MIKYSREWCYHSPDLWHPGVKNWPEDKLRCRTKTRRTWKVGTKITAKAKCPCGEPDHHTHCSGCGCIVTKGPGGGIEIVIKGLDLPF